MKKALSYFFILLGIALLAISDSKDLTEAILNKRSGISGWFGLRQWNNAGDLVSMSYLYDEKKFVEKGGYHFTKPLDTVRKNIELYVWGDSHLRYVPDSAFALTGHYHFGRRDFTDLNYKLDAGKKNILVIETAERFARPYFSNLSIFNHVKKEEDATTFSGASSIPVTDASLFGINLDAFYNHDINRNLEFNLFDYNFINPIRLLKARYVYELFHRASGQVVLSDDGKYLFLRETIAAHGFLSSYDPIGVQESSQMMNNIDTIYRHYKKEGFDEVYLSIIPNPASILQPDRYNELIPSIQMQASVKGIPVIDVYRPFSHHPDPGSLYRIGDTHWNNNGIQIWLQIVNDELRKIANQPS